MAACAASHHLKLLQNQPPTTKPKRRKCREISLSSSGAGDGATTPPPSSPPAYPQASPPNSDLDSHSDRKCGTGTLSNTSQSPCQKAEHSPGRSAKPPPMPLMEFSHSPSNAALYDVVHGFPSSFTKFNSALTAGLLNPMSPPPPTPPRTPPIARSSPSLFEMMVSEPDSHLRRAPTKAQERAAAPSAKEKKLLMQQRISDVLGKRSPGNAFNNPDSGDIRLTLSDKDGFSVNLSVHRQILVANSVFFAGRLAAHQRPSGVPFEVEISDCENVEVYVETLRLMYCKNLRRMLINENVAKILGILKISAAIGFDAGVFSCLELLEAAPWTEEEEEQVTSLLSELRIEGVQANEVLKRISIDKSSSNSSEEVLKKLLQVVLQGKDERARREMKGLFSKLLRESANHNDISKESLYFACDGCLNKLRDCFLQAADSDLQEVNQIAREAGNLQWLLEILIDRGVAGEFVKKWASETAMAEAHLRIGGVHRYEVSRVTARLAVGIGRGEVVAAREARCMLMKTWLGALYEDFGWMRRVSKGLDRDAIEDGVSKAVLTLPFPWQREIMMGWFERFVKCGEDCLNLQRGFEVWWRRAFWRRNGEEDDDGSCLRITNGEDE